MRHIIFFLAAILLGNILFAQKRFFGSMGTARNAGDKEPLEEFDLKITYRYSFQLDTLGRATSTHNDRYILEVGRSVSRFYSEYGEIRDSMMYRFAQANRGSERGVNVNSWMGEFDLASYEDVFMNHPEKGQLTVTAKIANSEFYYEEPLPVHDWAIESETADILGYTCLKAKTRFRGREWTAWYAPELPVNAGPWKFNGLPGAILKLSDSDQRFDYEAIGIAKPESGAMIHIHDRAKIRWVKLKRSDYLAMQRKQWEDPVGVLISQGIRMRFGNPNTGQSSEGQAGDVVLPYRPPLELE